MISADLQNPITTNFTMIRLCFYITSPAAPNVGGVKLNETQDSLCGKHRNLTILNLTMI